MNSLTASVFRDLRPSLQSCTDAEAGALVLLVVLSLPFVLLADIVWIPGYALCSFIGRLLRR